MATACHIMKVSGWHRWIGMTVGLFIALQGLGGALLLFRMPLNRLIHPEAFGPAIATAVDANVAAARATGCAINRIDLPDQTPGLLFFHLTCAGEPFVATAGDGRILRLAPRWRWPMEWLFHYHYQLGAGTAGQQAVGWIGAALLTLCLTGAWLLWRTARRDGWRSLLRPDLSAAPARRWRDLHRSAGLYLLPLLILLALTGLGMAWTASLTSILPVTPRPAPQVAAQPDVPLLPLSTILDRARASVAGPQPSAVRLPDGQGRVVMVMLGPPDSPDYHQLWFNGYDGTPIAARRAEDRSPADRFMDLLYPLHTGSLLGIPGTIMMMLAGLCLPGLAATGLWQWSRRSGAGALPMRARELVYDGAGVLLIRLCHRHGLPLPAFGPGDHIDLYLPNGLVRQYSLCGRPGRRRHYEIAVRLSESSTGGSAWIHANLKKGMNLDISRPRAHFPLDKGKEPVLLLAGGIGVTPLFSMAWAMWASGRPFQMLVCARSPDSHALAATITATPWAAFCHWHDSATHGRIDLPRLLSAQPSGTHLYLCGPGGFMEAAIDQARRLGWPADHLHWEAFAPATPSGNSFTINVQGRHLGVAANESLLDRLLAEGIALPHSCRRGLCGQCIVTVRTGTVDHRDNILTEAERAAGRMTACCSRAAEPGGHLDLAPP